MPIGVRITDYILQQNRESNVSSTNFFHVIDSQNVDFNVKGIQTDNTLVPTASNESKYIITNPANLHSNFGSISGLGSGDIVRHDGTSFKIYLDVSNTKTDEGSLVYNEDDKQYYFYNGTDWVTFGLIGVEGTENQIIVQNNQNSGPLQTNSNKIIGFPNTGIVVPNSVTAPLIIFSGNGVTMGGSVNGILILTGGMEITGNLNIKGNLTVDGTISTSTAFRGDSTNNQPESLGEDTYMDAGEY